MTNRDRIDSLVETMIDMCVMKIQARQGKYSPEVQQQWDDRKKLCAHLLAELLVPFEKS